MSLASMPAIRSAVLALFAALIITACLAADASAVNVKLRVEGATTTQFSGTVNTNARSVPGGTDTPECRANSTAASFASPNGLTAVADALGDANVATSGGYYGWGTLLCGVNGEFPATTLAGWLVRINQQDSTAPNGYVTATDPLSEGDSIVIYMSPTYGAFTASLELGLPTSVKPGVPVTGFVDSYSKKDDSKSPASGATIAGGSASATSGDDGTFSITFPTEGKFLVTAEKADAVRGSQWVTVDDGVTPVPVTPPTQKQVNQQRRIAARARCKTSVTDNDSLEYRICIRNANQLGRTLTDRQRRINARERCRVNYPARRGASFVTCIRDANRIGR